MQNKSKLTKLFRRYKNGRILKTDELKYFSAILMSNENKRWFLSKLYKLWRFN